ncbi:hypothetical protein [Sphaerochaeta halotolerans]|uniref:hypothetical protein n=1 Tax=Sphaerochaeta halotolerans TaxID=2293840 RepID=UPI001371EB51|nr:hypothetical protein [Sphaerochaeta halotolerans]MXI85250.1 hypothetical protein [Sphaerochaeta halotolerans]
MACKRLSDEQSSRKRFDMLAIYGAQHQFDIVGPDYFSVSLPETSVYHSNNHRSFLSSIVAIIWGWAR